MIRTITLISTYHEEYGLANCNELYKILNERKPEIIFEEIPPSFFDLYYKDKTKSRLETKAILMYLIEHDIQHIPVDYFNVPNNFFNETGKVIEFVERRSRTYRNLHDYSMNMLGRNGFPYLNSIAYEDISSEINIEIKETLKLCKDPQILEIWTTWEIIEQEREIKMLDNIFDYSAEHKYENGVFLLGAGHRVSIKDKIGKWKNGEISFEYLT
jgi:hypothetical protein